VFAAARPNRAGPTHARFCAKTTISEDFGMTRLNRSCALRAAFAIGVHGDEAGHFAMCSFVPPWMAALVAIEGQNMWVVGTEWDAARAASVNSFRT
jgi:hypothetical protein